MSVEVSECVLQAGDCRLKTLGWGLLAARIQGQVQTQGSRFLVEGASGYLP